MAVNPSHTKARAYYLAIILLMVAIAIVVKLVDIQWIKGKALRSVAKAIQTRPFAIPANRGSIYSSDGNLLAATMTKYNVHCDASVLAEIKSKYLKTGFDDQLDSLCQQLSRYTHKDASSIKAKLSRAIAQKKYFVLPFKGIDYTQYAKLRQMPLFRRPRVLVYESYNVPAYPLGLLARRMIGDIPRYQGEKHEIKGNGIELAFDKYLRGEDGVVMKQRFGTDMWKPVHDDNSIEKEPRDGYDVVSTINVGIQDIVHHSLLEYLEKYKADHGTAVVMETQTGYIRAISNLQRVGEGKYYDADNYAIKYSHEPGSTFKLVDLIALLEDGKADTSSVFSTQPLVVAGKSLADEHPIHSSMASLSKGFEKSSNVIMARAVYSNYRANPQAFIDRIKSFGFAQGLGLPFKGEGKPVIWEPGTKGWNGLTLRSMAYGYAVQVTPLQTLSLYNAIANNGRMVRPLFVSEIRDRDQVVKRFEPEVINPKVCSPDNVTKIKGVMERVVKFGTAHDLYSKDFSMAGKTGTVWWTQPVRSQKSDSSQGKVVSERQYASSFVGFFPVEKPKYSCIVIVYNPDKSKGYYGAEVAGPVFKRIAQKVYADSPFHHQVKHLNRRDGLQKQSYDRYWQALDADAGTVPDVKGMPAMDALALLENLKLKVRLKGKGKVKKQSLAAGTALRKNQTIYLELS